MWVVESQIHQQYLFSLCSTIPLRYVLQCTDANSPEKKDQVLKT